MSYAHPEERKCSRDFPIARMEFAATGLFSEQFGSFGW